MKLEFHRINYLSSDIEAVNYFYANILKMDPLPTHNFIWTTATRNSEYGGKIKFTAEGNMQMHLAERDLNVAKKIESVKTRLKKGTLHSGSTTSDSLKNT